MGACDISRKARIKRTVIRGVAGASLLGVAVYFFIPNPTLSFVFVLLSLIPMRGCPACWIADMHAAWTAKPEAQPAEKTPPDSGKPV